MQSACQLHGIESRDVAQRNQSAVLRAHVCEDIAEVDVADMGVWIRGGGRGSIEGDQDLEHPTPTPTTRQLSGFVDGDRDEPRSKALGIADRVQFPPGDRPSRLDRLLAELDITRP